jgi:hypothetical protein
MSINRKVTRDAINTIFHNTVRGKSFVVTGRQVGLTRANAHRWFWYIFDDVYRCCLAAQIPVRRRDVTLNGIRLEGEFWAEQFERFKHSIFKERGL